MVILLLVAFAAGLVTVLSPCILPVLPIILGSSVNGGKSRPLGVVAGLIVSFSIFTLAAAQIVVLLHLPATTLRYIAIAIIIVLGLSLVIPAFNQWFERLFSRLPGLAPTEKRSGFWGGVITGASLGLHAVVIRNGRWVRNRVDRPAQYCSSAERYRFLLIAYSQGVVPGALC